MPSEQDCEDGIDYDCEELGMYGYGPSNHLWSTISSGTDAAIDAGSAVLPQVNGAGSAYNAVSSAVDALDNYNSNAATYDSPTIGDHVADGILSTTQGQNAQSYFDARQEDQDHADAVAEEWGW